jgi:hypothetical protein
MPKMALIALAILVAVLAAVVALYSTGGLDSGGRISRAAKDDGAHGKGTLLPDAVLSIAPRSGSAPIQSPARKLPPSLQEFHDAKSYAAIHARLSKSTTRTGEEDWMLAQILQRCAKFAEDEPERFKPWKLGTPEARTRFAASLAANDPDRDKRLAAFDGVNFDPCGDLSNIEMSRKDLRALLQAGADAGDPKARAALVQFDVNDQMRGPDGKIRWDPSQSMKLGDSQVDTLRQAIASGDPYAMRTAISTMSSGIYNNFSLRDADDRPLNYGALWQASTLVSCDFGFDCGPNAQMIQNGCAFSGYCAANNLADYMMYYQSSPASSQMIATYQGALRNAASSGDWSYFHFYPGPNPATAAFMQPKGP